MTPEIPTRAVLNAACEDRHLCRRAGITDREYAEMKPESVAKIRHYLVSGNPYVLTRTESSTETTGELSLA